MASYKKCYSNIRGRGHFKIQNYDATAADDGEISDDLYEHGFPRVIPVPGIKYRNALSSTLHKTDAKDLSTLISP